MQTTRLSLHSRTLKKITHTLKIAQLLSLRPRGTRRGAARWSRHTVTILRTGGGAPTVAAPAPAGTDDVTRRRVS